MSGELKNEDHNNKNIELNKISRIPQRLYTGGRVPQKTKPVNNNDTIKNKNDHSVVSRYSKKYSTRPRSVESSRPKSANRVKNETNYVLQNIQYPARTIRNDYEKQIPGQKKTAHQISKRHQNEKKYDSVSVNRPPIPTITVPSDKSNKISRVTHPDTLINSPPRKLPDQETIIRCEELELACDAMSDDFLGNSQDDSYVNLDINIEDSQLSRSDKIMRLKMNFQEKMALYDKMKNNVNDRQHSLVKLYASMRNCHKQLAYMGQRITLPDDLKIMNVAKMTPEQLLQLCGDAKPTRDENTNKNCLKIDMSKLNNIPTKLVALCEQVLKKRFEVIEWVDNLKNAKGYSISTLNKKVSELNAENEMLKSSLQTTKVEFLKELNDVMDIVRKCVNETISIQLRHEELTCEVCDLSTKNSDLRKQLHLSEQCKSSNNKAKIEELLKDLKEEKTKNLALRNRLTRSDGQVRMGEERAVSLEASLNHSRSQMRQLERTIQQLQEQNQRIQLDFDTELKKMNESIKENTSHLEEIATARENLQSEKEYLEKRLEELSTNYDESINNLKGELNNKVHEVIETERNYNELEVEKKRLEGIIENQCAQLVEMELKYKDTMKKLHDNETRLSKCLNAEHELVVMNDKLEMADSEIERYKELFINQTESVKEIERKFKDSHIFVDKLKSDITTKDDYIEALEKKLSLLEEQLLESESKMVIYEEQLSSLKDSMKLQEQLVENENKQERKLQELLNQQITKNIEISEQNEKLEMSIKAKQIELEDNLEALTNYDNEIQKQNNIIEILTNKEEEQSRIIKLLKNKLDLANTDTSNQIFAKDNKIETLSTALEKKKEQISQLEKIILALEDQMQDNKLHKLKDQEKINLLEQKLEEFQAYIDKNDNLYPTPTENIDSLFKILEDELGDSFVHQYKSSKNKTFSNCVEGSKAGSNRNQHEYKVKHQYQDQNKNSSSTNVTGCIGRNTCVPNNESFSKGDKLHRKKANTKIDTQKWDKVKSENDDNLRLLKEKTDLTSVQGFVHSKDISHDMDLLIPDNYRDDRKYKMFKLAGHKI